MAGGAVFLAGNDATWTLTNVTSSTFYNNSATDGNGGALSLAGGFHLFVNNTFKENMAARAGGALVYQHSCTDGGTFFGEHSYDFTMVYSQSRALQELYWLHASA